MNSPQKDLRLNKLVLAGLAFSLVGCAYGYTSRDLGATVALGSGYLTMVPAGLNSSGSAVVTCPAAQGANTANTRICGLRNQAVEPPAPIPFLYPTPTTGYLNATISHAGPMLAPFDPAYLLGAGNVMYAGTGINDLGDTVGTGAGPAVGYGTRGMLWRGNIYYGLLSTAPGFPAVVVTDINNSGTAVGYAQGPTQPPQPVLWTSVHPQCTGDPTGNPPGAATCSGFEMIASPLVGGPEGGSGAALAINSIGSIVGAYDFQGNEQAWIFSLPDHLKTDIAPAGKSRAFDINDSDMVVGSVIPDGGHRTAWLWRQGDTQATRLSSMGGPAGVGDSDAFGINNKGFVVGRSIESMPGGAQQEPLKACLWGPLDISQGSVTDLSAAAGKDVFLSAALRINDSGVILAEGHPTANPQETHSYVLTPITP